MFNLILKISYKVKESARNSFIPGQYHYDSINK